MEDAYCFVIPVFRVRFVSLKQRPILLEGISASLCVYRFTSTQNQKQAPLATEIGATCPILHLHCIKLNIKDYIFNLYFFKKH